MGHAFQSSLRRWDVLIGLCQSMNAKTLVEIGCKDGRTTGALLAACPQLHVIAIDPWAPVPNAHESYDGWDFEKIERDFWGNVCSCKWNKLAHAPECSSQRCTMLRTTSEQASQHVFLPLADIVFIDAAHDFENVLRDIRAWWPHVRDGGYLCGHDYQHPFPEVMRAVAASFSLLRVAVCPDSVWIVQKDETLQLKEVA